MTLDPQHSGCARSRDCGPRAVVDKTEIVKGGGVDTRQFRVRRIPPTGLGVMLGTARLRACLRLREAARLVGISHPYLIQLETGQRCPSVTVARKLIEVLGLDDEESVVLLGVSVDDAGRDHPARGAA